MNKLHKAPATEDESTLVVPGLLDINELGQVLNISVSSLYKRRSLGEPMPPAVRIGSALRWRPADVEQFLVDQLESTDDARAA